MSHPLRRKSHLLKCDTARTFCKSATANTPYAWRVMSHIWMSHVTLKTLSRTRQNECTARDLREKCYCKYTICVTSCVTHEWVMSHLRHCHEQDRMNAQLETFAKSATANTPYAWRVISHIWMSHVTLKTLSHTNTMLCHGFVTQNTQWMHSQSPSQKITSNIWTSHVTLKTLSHNWGWLLRKFSGCCVV